MHALSGIRTRVYSFQALHGTAVRSSSAISIALMKLQKIRWTVKVAPVDEKRNTHRILIRKPEGRAHLEGLGVDGDVILNRI